MSDRFLRACRRQPVDTTPVWLMRQAGRYMPEYRAVRAGQSMLETLRRPDLACAITLQPVDAFALDAAIIFADILPPLIGMGLPLRYEEGRGPVLERPIRTPADVDALRTPPPQENVPYTLEAIRLVRRELAERVPLIGFAGAPFTLASYAIEGGGSRHYRATKTFMATYPDAWARLMEKLTRVVGDYLLAQVQAGAQALQLFDSWAGVLSPPVYRRQVLPYVQRVFERVRPAAVPLIYFGTNLNGLLRTLPQTGADVIGVDWRIDLADAWTQLGDVAVQGNLDPVALLAPWPALREQIDHVLAQANGRAGHIFNLGHGILPQTPVDNVRRLVDYVHEHGARNLRSTP